MGMSNCVLSKERVDGKERGRADGDEEEDAETGRSDILSGIDGKDLIANQN